MCARRFLFVVFILILLAVAAAVAMFQFGNRVLIKSAIPKGHYGAGNVIVWDEGSWEPVGDAKDSLAKGKLIFHLHGQKLAGLWELVRISKPHAKQEQWLLLKKRGDEWYRPHIATASRLLAEVTAGTPLEQPLSSVLAVTAG